VLNGLWRWLPAAGPSAAAPAPTADWGLIWVPGAWGTRQWGYYNNTGPGSGTTGVQKPGLSEEWKVWNESLRRAWYERDLTVPAAWAGRDILLGFDRIATDAEVWLDGTRLGSVAWPGGELDLTAAVKPGQIQRLRLAVAAVQTAGEAIDYMGVGQNTATKASLDLRGISGDVVLLSRPASARIADVFVKTSVRQKRLSLDADLIGVPPGQPLRLTALVRSAQDGTLAQTFSAEVKTTAPDSASTPDSSSSLRDLGWAWADPVLWDLDSPHLYRLELQLQFAPSSATTTSPSAPPADAWPVTFGFREFWTEGRDFYLNGTVIRLRPALFGGQAFGIPTRATAEADLLRWKDHGRNFAEVWPQPKTRGARVQDTVVAEAADRVGLLLAMPTVRINEFAHGPGYRDIWDTPEGRAAWLPLFHADWRRLRNHPSIVMLGLSGNFGGHDHDQNPRWLGRRALPPGEKTKPVQADADTLARAFDPTRLLWHHQGGIYGDVFTVNHYLNFIPLQEREEWLSEWSRTGDMPYSGVEFGTPFNASFLRGRDGFGNSITSEPFLAEYAAIYLGADAYRLQGDAYARAIRTRFERPDTLRNGRWTSWQNRPELNASPAFQAIQELFITRTWRAWRTDGVSGGMIPWDDGYAFTARALGKVPVAWQPGQRGWFQPEVNAAALRTSFKDKSAFTLTPAGRALEAANSPLLAWIAGPAGRLHAKDHHLAAGAVLEKQLALLNDTRVATTFAAHWHVEDAATTSVLEKGRETGRIQPGETKLLPVAFRAPADLAPNTHRDLVLVLTADFTGQILTDRFAFRVYGPAPATELPAVTLYDPANQSAALLTALGLTPTPLRPGAAPDPKNLLVLGRNALVSGPLAFDLGAYVAAGGRALLLAQSPSWISQNLGLRIAPVPARRLFQVPTTSDYFTDMDATDLSDWNGAGTLVEARPDHAASSLAPPAQGWRWGNAGSVSSAMIEKSHRSGWTPLLEGEWDLAYTPLQELHYGKGRLTWCTLDLEDQVAADPAADRLARHVLTSANRPVTQPRLPEAVYVGTDAGAATLDLTGLAYRRATQPDPKVPLLLVDAATPLTDSQLEAFARQGGTVVMLAQPGGDTPPRLGTALALTQGFLGGVAPEANALTRGLSASDLRWRAPLDLHLLTAAGGTATVAGGLLGARAVGPGRIVFVQFDPARFDLEKQPFYKHTQWRLTRALTQILANLGASFAADRMIFYPQVLRTDLAGPWAVNFTRELPLASWEKPHADPGLSPAATALLADRVDNSAWPRFDLPANHPRFSEVSGEAVWRREVVLPADRAGEMAILHIPGIKSFDTVAINGTVVGSTSKTTDPKNPNPWNIPRAYRIAPGILRAGSNVIAIRQFVPDKDGGINGRADRFYLQLLVPETRRLHAYADNWNDDAKYGDDPYRYYRW
jgi:beta-galactosidase